MRGMEYSWAFVTHECNAKHTRFLVIEDSAKPASFGSDVFRHTRRIYRHLLYPAHTLLVRG